MITIKPTSAQFPHSNHSINPPQTNHPFSHHCRKHICGRQFPKPSRRLLSRAAPVPKAAPPSIPHCKAALSLPNVALFTIAASKSRRRRDQLSPCPCRHPLCL
ncbi:hypothetical protein M0R45_021049 [Rubus argutus]|uniref:Uncharacterized protein n=1 Tax=Rubus argutus TaxID=59490 RepID=A0AAW1XCD6_RUBAR